ncbi:hypothetical protein JOQ06_000198, partial [Pogonophryne albipinna]
MLTLSPLGVRRSSGRTLDLWWGGLPPSVRGRVWSRAIGNELSITPDLYEIFVSRARGRSLSDEAQSVMDRDGGPYHEALQSILGAYTCYRPDVGYVSDTKPLPQVILSPSPQVQGSASMAAVLLLNMEELQVFISLSNLSNRPCRRAFSRGDHPAWYPTWGAPKIAGGAPKIAGGAPKIAGGAPKIAGGGAKDRRGGAKDRRGAPKIAGGMLRYFRAFQVILQEFLPRLFLHFQSAGVTPDLYLLDWILSLYLKPLPLEVSSRVWDVYLRDGEDFLFRTALGILSLHQNVLLELELVSIAQFLSRLPEEELLSDRLFSCIAATPPLSGNRKWTQHLGSLVSTWAQWLAPGLSGYHLGSVVTTWAHWLAPGLTGYHLGSLVSTWAHWLPPGLTAPNTRRKRPLFGLTPPLRHHGSGKNPSDSRRGEA